MAMRRTKAQWAEIIGEYKKSGQTMASWCRENGVNAKTMGNHVTAGNVKRKVRTLYEWGVLLEQQKSSGMSISGWCRDNGIKEKAMRTAASKLEKLQESKNSEQEAASAEWVSVKISEVPSVLPSSAMPDGVTFTQSTAQTSDDEYNPITKPVKLPQDSEKGTSVWIRLKSLEVEVSNEYPVEKLTILMRGLIDLC